MTVRPPLTALVLALVLGLLAAYATACGSSDKGLLTSNKADSLKASLDDLDEHVAAGQCDRARSDLADIAKKVATLPPSTDPKLRRRIERGAANLADVAPQDCQDAKNETDTQPTTTETTPTDTTPTTTTETTPTETTPPTTTATTPTTPTTTTPTTPTTPTQTTPPDGTGGDQAPNVNGAGFVPPGQAKKDHAR